MTSVQFYVLIMFIMITPDLRKFERNFIALVYTVFAVIAIFTEVLK